MTAAPEMGAPPLAIVTIGSNVTLPDARLLLGSARRHHPEAALYLGLADRPLDAPTAAGDDVTVIAADALAIPDFAAFAFRHEADEFRVALKPFVLRSILDRGHRGVIFLDIAAGIFARLDPLLVLLARPVSIVLVPRLCSPLEDARLADLPEAASDGIWAPSLFAARAGPETDDLLSWWSARLLHHRFAPDETVACLERRILAALPGIGDNVRILRDPASNVTSRTATARGLARDADGWRVGRLPLRVFDFGVASIPRARDDAEAGPTPLEALVGERARHLADATALWFPVPAAVYEYGRFRSNVVIPPVLRRIFRETAGDPTADPFDTYERDLAQPWPEQWAGSTASVVTHLMAHLRARDDTLRRDFDIETQAGVEAYAAWFSRHGDARCGAIGLAAPVDARLATRQTGVGRSAPEVRSGRTAPELRSGRTAPELRSGRTAPPRLVTDTADVTVIGYLRAAMGVGEAGRKVLQSLDRAGLDAKGLETRLNVRSPIVDDSSTSLLVPRGESRFLLFNINCDQLPLVLADLAPVLRADAYRILMPFWELSGLPAAWIPHLDLVDEIWAPTRFIRSMLIRATGKPVTLMPLPLAIPPMPRTPSRAALGLPDGFLFFFAFDFLSFPQRKNPLGAAAAFRRAFRAGTPVGCRVGLVVKALNAGADPFHDTGFLDELRRDPDVTVLDAVLGREETLATIAACDAVVSLHRSEGLGLLVAEAMALGVPVVATDYSGTTDLLSVSTGWPVDARLVPVGPGQYPFHEGQVWADPDLDHAAWQMRRVVLDREEVRRRAARARLLVAASTTDAAGRRMASRLQAIESPRA